MHVQELLLIVSLITGFLSLGTCTTTGIDMQDVMAYFREQPSSLLGGIVEITAIILVNAVLVNVVSLPTIFIGSILLGPHFGIRFTTFALSMILWQLCLSVGGPVRNLGGPLTVSTFVHSILNRLQRM